MDALEQRIEGKINALEQRMEGRMDAREQRIMDRFTEALRETETRLLQAFYSFAETNHKRFTQTEAATAMAVSRLTTLESRVLELEKRLNIPPAA
jgi:uncharacterized protein YceH (UPF0502 family)